MKELAGDVVVAAHPARALAKPHAPGFGLLLVRHRVRDHLDALTRHVDADTHLRVFRDGVLVPAVDRLERRASDHEVGAGQSRYAKKLPATGLHDGLEGQGLDADEARQQVAAPVVRAELAQHGAQLRVQHELRHQVAQGRRFGRIVRVVDRDEGSVRVAEPDVERARLAAAALPGSNAHQPYTRVPLGKATH